MTASCPPFVALIAGPTASGKSALAVALAERHRGTVINADSAQVYADLHVLSARPTREEEARVPHRLFGYIDGADACSARSEEHTSELQSLMRISYAVFCLNNKTKPLHVDANTREPHSH